MDAWICRGSGGIDGLETGAWDVAPPGPGEALIRVAGCGINYPDVLMIEGRYQVQPPSPFVPGGEISGTIQAVGEGLAGLSIGQRVMATIFYGGLTREAVVPAGSVVAVPDSMDLRTASVFQGGHTTSYFALKQRARLMPGESLLVLGAAGGVGMAAMQLGQAMGARVIGAVSTREKADALRRQGFDEVIDLGSDDVRTALKRIVPAGVDVIFDPVGGDLLEQASRSVARNSRVLIVGFASGKIASYPTNIVLLKESAVVGVNYQSFFQHEPAAVKENFAELFAMRDEGKIAPAIHHVYAFGEAKEALKAMQSRRVIGKVLVDVES